MADEGLQAVSGQEGKGSLHPKMEKNLYSRWFRIEGAPRRVSFCRFYGVLGGKHRRGRIKKSDFDKSRALLHNSGDLKSAGDSLWENASQDNHQNFIDLLKKAQYATNRGRLLIKEEHSNQLRDTFKAFENYQIGKRRLIDLRFPGAMGELFKEFDEQKISNQIQQNATSRQIYEKLVEEILIEFRQQLGLAA